MSPGRSPSHVAGVDGCRGGWVVVRTGPRAGSRSSLEVLPALEPLLAEVRDGRIDTVCIDMPIGLPESGPRACDTDARRLLGPRRSTVFPTPPRVCLSAPDHATASERARAATGSGISVQAFNLLPRIAELDAALRSEPGLVERIVETHPECCFVSLTGAALDPKRTTDGRGQRLDALRPLFAELDGWLVARPRGTQPHDILDAAVLAWTARRHRAGRTTVLGDGRVDGCGLPMRIVC